MYIELRPCPRPTCDVVWLLDLGATLPQDGEDIEAFWKRDIRDGATALICKSCYARVRDMLQRRVVRGLLSSGEIPWAEGPSAVGWDQAPAPSPHEDENNPTWI